MVQTFNHPLLTCARAAALLGVALTAAAQPAARSTSKPLDPLDPKAIVPQVSYRSAFDAYKGFGDTQLLSWREANDTVARIGGWRVYTREAQAPDAAPAALPDAPAKAPLAGHSGHKTP